MASNFCPNCGTQITNSSSKFCQNCGCELNSNHISDIKQPQASYSGRTINIHGYTQWFAVDMPITIHLNGNSIGTVKKGEIFKLNVDSPCQLKFTCSFRSTTLDVNPFVDNDVFLSFDRFSGCLLATKSIESNIENIDKPNIGLDILSFLIPIIGLILFFVKKSQYPNCAKAYLICCICGFLFNMAVMFL